jgi:pimeloyl-ACP methyl ester carboxylesterase
MSNSQEPRDLSVDLNHDAGGPLQLAATYFPPAGHRGDKPILVCLPGGTCNRSYFDLIVPGLGDYSFARHAAALGFPVVAFDHLGTGASSRPDREVSLEDQADALASALDVLPSIIEQPGPQIAVAHSMGGYVAIFQQARHRSYEALVILGTTNQVIAHQGISEAYAREASTKDGRAKLTQELVEAIPDLYLDGFRDSSSSWCFLDDVPHAVIEVDARTTVTVVPRMCAASSFVPGVTLAAAAEIDVPVFLGYGELDVSPSPENEPGFFPQSPEVELMVLGGSAHCHNAASTRLLLWERLETWCDSHRAGASS